MLRRRALHGLTPALDYINLCRQANSVFVSCNAYLYKYKQTRSFSGENQNQRTPFRVIQAQVIFRHGDRSPTFNCFTPYEKAAAVESLAWGLALPPPELVEQYTNAFPAHGDTPSPLGRGKTQKQTLELEPPPPRDIQLGVFGSLTQLGLLQARTLGKVLRAIYVDGCYYGVNGNRDVCPVLLPTTQLRHTSATDCDADKPGDSAQQQEEETLSSKEKVSREFRSALRVSSSNYQRTLLSAGGVLGGLLGLQSLAAPTPPPIDATGEEGSNGCLAQRTDSDDEVQGQDDTIIEIKVRYPPTFKGQLLPPSASPASLSSVDYINPFPYCARLRSLFQVIASRAPSEPTDTGEVPGQSLRQIVSNAVPAFATHVLPFRWTFAADHFQCRAGRLPGYSGHQTLAHEPDNCRPHVSPLRLEYLKALFKRYDINSDWRLDELELRQLLLHMSNPPLSDNDMSLIFNAIQVEQGIEDEKNCGIEYDRFMWFVQHPLQSLLKDGLESKHANEVEQQLNSTFKSMFQDQRVLALSAGRAFSVVEAAFAKMFAHTSSNANTPQPRLLLHSGHDVTLLPLLHALMGGSDFPWPGYCSALRIELLQRIDDTEANTDDKSAGSNADAADDFYVGFHFSKGETGRAPGHGYTGTTHNETHERRQAFAAVRDSVLANEVDKYLGTNVEQLLESGAFDFVPLQLNIESIIETTSQEKQLMQNGVMTFETFRKFSQCMTALAKNELKLPIQPMT